MKEQAEWILKCHDQHQPIKVKDLMQVVGYIRGRRVTETPGIGVTVKMLGEIKKWLSEHKIAEEALIEIASHSIKVVEDLQPEGGDEVVDYSIDLTDKVIDVKPNDNGKARYSKEEEREDTEGPDTNGRRRAKKATGIDKGEQ
jgi:hypothetical protein